MTTADKRKQQHHHSWSEMFHRKSRFKEAAGRSDPNGGKSRFKEAAGRSDPNGHPETQRPNPSGRFPHASTRMRTCPGAGSGSARSTRLSTPGRAISTVVYVVLILGMHT